MESVIFDGKEFVKASVLAEKFSYTQDYLGQLCRGKRVDARLVGRAWYINLDSLNSHRIGRYKNIDKPVSVTPIITSHNYVSRIDVEPVLKRKTVNIMKNESGKLTDFSMKYEKDDYSLIPKVNKSPTSSHPDTVPAETQKVIVHNTSDHAHITNFKAEPLPEVFSAGALLVEGIGEAIEEIHIESSQINKVSAETPVLETKKPIHTLKIRTLDRFVTKPKQLAAKTVLAPPIGHTARQNSLNIKHPPHSFTPNVLKVSKPAETVGEGTFLLPTASLIVALISGFFILSTEVLIETTTAHSNTYNFVIKAENVTQAAKVVFSSAH